MYLHVESDYDVLRARIAEALEAAADAHDGGNLSSIKEGFEEIDHSLPRNNEPRYKKLYIGLNFWDGWIDARNHEWLYYEGISREDWSVLARKIAQNLRNDLEIDDKHVLRHFDLQKPPRKSLFTRLRGYVNKRSFK